MFKARLEKLESNLKSNSVWLFSSTPHRQITLWKKLTFLFIYNPNLTSELSNFIANSTMIIVLSAVLKIH